MPLQQARIPEYATTAENSDKFLVCCRNLQPLHTALITIHWFSADPRGLSQGRLSGQHFKNILCEFQSVPAEGLISTFPSGNVFSLTGLSHLPMSHQWEHRATRQNEPRDLLCAQPDTWASLAFWRLVETRDIDVEEGKLAPKDRLRNGS